MNNAILTPNPTGPAAGIHIDEDLCIGCNSCARICRIQTILPNPEKGKPPIVAYPDECWYCGVCVEACPAGALEMKLPINQRILFKDKETGEIFRLDTKDAPEKTFFKAPYGWLDHQELGVIIQALERTSMGGGPVVAILGSDVPQKVARAFGEKTQETDWSDKLIRFMKLVGFADCSISVGRAETDGASDIRTEQSDTTGQTEIRDMTIVAVDYDSPDKVDYSISAADLTILLKRLCVSSFTAVHIWRSL